MVYLIKDINKRVAIYRTFTMNNQNEVETINYKNCLIKICYDDNSGNSPREWTNNGYFITVDSRYNSPDKNEELQSIIKEGGECCNSQQEHIDYIKKNYSEKILAIYPVVKYEHSGISYSLGTVKGFDYSNNGFYIVTEKTAKETGVKPKDFEKVAKQELELYNNWCNGEVYGFIAEDEYGNDIGSCWGFYSTDDAISDAKGNIDYYIENILPKVKREKLLHDKRERHNINLLDLKNSDSETIRRLSQSLIKQLSIK